MNVNVIVQLPGTEMPASPATVRVYIEETARADAAAVAVAETAVNVRQLSSTIPVAIASRDPSGQESFTVRVHVDRDGSGQVSPGDFVSTAAHPVREGTVEVPVRPVG